MHGVTTIYTGVERQIMYRILCPIDTSETRARAQAKAILDFPGEPGEVDVDVVHIRQDARGADGDWAAGGFAEEYAEAMDDIADRSLPGAVDHVTDEFDAAGVEYTIYEAQGDPAETILTFAADRGCDMIVIGARRRSPVGKVLFGSVAQGVILDSSCPVTVVPGNSADTE